MNLTQLRHDPTDIADVIMRAHDELMTNGWCRFKLEDREGRHCATGALAAACNLRMPVSERLYYPALETDGIVFEAEAVLTGVLRDRCGYSWLTAWNDQLDRTEDEVLDLFLDTAKTLREYAAA